MTWKLYAVVSAGAFVATYLMSSPANDVVERPSPAAAAESARQSAAATEIEALADSLRIPPRAQPAPGSSARDPFRFQSRAAKPPAFVPPPPVVEPVAAVAPVLPILSLTGIATDTENGKTQRSAVLSMPAGVLIVREGESVAGLYTVVAIGEDSIELAATADGSRRTLRLGR